MDLGEKFFEIISNWRRHKQAGERAANQYALSDCEKALAVVIQPLFEDPVEIHSSKQSGVRGTSFYLPPFISFFKDRQKNRELYLHQILMMAGAQKLSFFWPENLPTESARITSFFEKKDLITNRITQIYPHFQVFQENLLEAFLSVAETPNQQWLLWGGLSSRGGGRRSQEPPPSSQIKPKSVAQYNIETSFDREEVDLEKESSNPVTHSFEKMETADEYQGGARATDGSDQIQEHSEALKELKLNKVTRSGESAASFLNSDFHGSSEHDLAAMAAKALAPNIAYYPEWHYKKKRYLSDHCCLRISTAEETDGAANFQRHLQVEYASLISRHRQQLMQVCNQRKWRGQQVDGSEVDVDAFVHHLVNIRNKVPSNGRLYLNQFLRSRDYQVLVLLDLSLSMDSYVDNRRVLDVELESVGLIGLLSEGLHDNTIVAGTFSETRHRCNFEVLKHAHESWDLFYRRGPGIVPRGYTRLGPAIRHATQILSKSSAKKKILLLLTDGKPTDFDGYEGRYGIDDIHKACLEAHARDITMKAFAIEKGARHYFPQMFSSYEVLSSPLKLPQSLVKTFLEARRR